MDKHTSEIAYAEIMSPTAGVLQYTLSKSEVDGSDSFSIGVKQITPDGKEIFESADDVSCEESTAVAVFQAVAEGEVEPCIFQDVIYDTLP